MGYYFNLPKFHELTSDQRAVLNDPNPIAISGGPGTGKTVVSLWRHIRNYESEGSKSLLLTYTKTLERYLIECCKNVDTKASQSINRTKLWYYSEDTKEYDEIIIDEAQDLQIDYYDKVIMQSRVVSFGADIDQTLYPDHLSNFDELSKKFESKNNYILNDNFRNTYEIMQFVRSTFPNKNISRDMMDELINRNSGPKPILNIANDDIEVIAEIIKNYGSSSTHNIAILVPLVNPAMGVNTVGYYYKKLQGRGIECSKYEGRDSESPVIFNVHITTYKSAKGIEFDTVIIPEFHKFKENMRKLYVVAENDYYVAFTRARRNLHLISDKEIDFLNSSTYEINDLRRKFDDDDLPF